MTKGQLKLLEQARKNGFTEEQVAILSHNASLKTLKYYYDLLQRGFCPSTIETIIQAGSKFANSFGFLLLEKEFSQDDVLKLINRTNALPWEKRYIYQQIMINKPKTEKDIFLRINYAEMFINLPELQDVKVLFDCIDCIIDAANFAIISNIPAKDFIDKFFPKTEESWTPFQLYDIFSEYMKQHVPYLLDLSLPDNNKREYEDKEISFASEMQAFIKAQIKLNNRTGQKHYITFSDVPMYYRKIKLNTKTINIRLKKSNTAKIDANGECDFSYISEAMEIVIFHNGGYYYIGANEKLYPLSLKKLSNIWNNYGKLGKQVVTFILHHAMEKLNAPVMKDILKTFEKDGFFLLPINFTECKNIHNYNRLLQKRWSSAENINWNRTDVNLAYLIIKSLPYLERDCDKNRLLQTKDSSLLKSVSPNCWKNKWNYEFVFLFLAEYILKDLKNVPEYSKDSFFYSPQHTICDYMRMTHEMHKKIKIGFKSWNKVKDIHNKTVDIYKNTPHKIRVPKNSKFNRLRELLPDNYEWIRTGNRLRTEGIEMGHCVNSYWNYINKDECAIYSFSVNEKRYTAEFRINRKGEYIINQIQSKYDRGCPAKVEEQVRKHLLKCS